MAKLQKKKGVKLLATREITEGREREVEREIGVTLTIFGVVAGVGSWCDFARWRPVVTHLM